MIARKLLMFVASALFVLAAAAIPLAFSLLGLRRR